MGIVPEALFNFLTLLGWSPGENREIFTRDEAAQWFDLGDVNKAPAVFDPEKLLWMNGQYLMRMTPEQIYPHLVPFLGDDPRPLDELRTIIELHKMRARTLRELAEQMSDLLHRRRRDRVRRGDGEEAHQRRRPRRAAVRAARRARHQPIRSTSRPRKPHSASSPNRKASAPRS